jgi:hypothetical protein
MEDRLESIYEGLRQKSTVKQTIYRNTRETFDQLRQISTAIVMRLQNKLTPVDSNVVIEYRNINEFEFHIKFSGDLLIFIMHSNIITLPDNHTLMESAYVNDDFKRRFFGHIMAYNFMADSIKFSRMNDPGYLLGRFLVNVDNHYYLEGVKQLDLANATDMTHNQINEEALRLFVESAMIASVNNDLIGPDLEDISKITVKQKMENQQVSRGQKLGFVFSYEHYQDN